MSIYLSNTLVYIIKALYQIRKKFLTLLARV